MTLLNSCNYVRPNLKLFHNIFRNQQINLEKRINYSKNGDNEPIDKAKQQKNEKSDAEKDEHEKDDTKKEPEKKEYPEEPTSCCMAGCANCVWLEYAEKLSEYYKDGGEQAMKEINEKVTDNNIKAFLLHELRMRQKK